MAADLWVWPNRAFVNFINSGFYSDFGGHPPGHLGNQLGGSWVPAGLRHAGGIVGFGVIWVV